MCDVYEWWSYRMMWRMRMNNKEIYDKWIDLYMNMGINIIPKCLILFLLYYARI